MLYLDWRLFSWQKNRKCTTMGETVRVGVLEPNVTWLTACTNCSQLYAVALWHIVLLFLVLAIICISTSSLQLEEVFSQLSRKPKELLTELKELWLRTSRNELPPTFLAHGLTSKLMTGLQGHLVRVSEPHTLHTLHELTFHFTAELLGPWLSLAKTQCLVLLCAHTSTWLKGAELIL